MLEVHSISAHSRVNGPGARTVVHFQGCTLACAGCFNPHTWKSGAGVSYRYDTLAEIVVALGDDGLTVSGGEPFQQDHDSLLDFLRAYRDASGKTVLAYSGYTTGELEQLGVLAKFRDYVDTIVSGRYEQDKKTAKGLLASSNQKYVYLSNRLDMSKTKTEVEVLIDGGGVTVTGFPTKRLLSSIRRTA